MMRSESSGSREATMVPEQSQHRSGQRKSRRMKRTALYAVVLASVGFCCAFRVPPYVATKNTSLLIRQPLSHVTTIRCSNTRLLETSSSIQESPRQWRHIIGDYVNLIRPYTLLQAVGALVVGCLATATQTPTLPAALSVYLSYGAGMAANDCVDANIDVLHNDKQARPIPSGRISVRNAWIFTATLAVASLLVAFFGCGTKFGVWTFSNLAIMLLYALGLQKVFLMKNILVGWLGVSPLIGAILLNDAVDTAATPQLLHLGAVGFAVGVAREILKDLEDEEVDRVAGKVTLPYVVGKRAAHGISFGLVAAACLACWSTGYRAMFASPIYAASTAIGTAMCVRASMLPVKKGQRLLKKSVYVLLAGMIVSLLIKR